jgi:hypothetical protein
MTVIRDARLVVAGVRATRNAGVDVRVRLGASWPEVSSDFLLLI